METEVKFTVVEEGSIVEQIKEIQQTEDPNIYLVVTNNRVVKITVETEED